MCKRYFLRLTGIMIGIWIFVWLIHIPKVVAAPVPGVTDDTITIGVLAPLSGPAALLGKSAQTVASNVLGMGEKY